MTPKTKARLYVVLIFICCVAPVVLSTLTYYVWKPQKRMNYGELLQATPVAFDHLKFTDGKPLTDNAFKGKWVMLLIDSPACNDACEQRLYAMRQTVLAMEMKKDKLVQVWMTNAVGSPRRELLAQYPQTILLAGDAAWVQQLPQPTTGHIFLIDPNGLPVLRYPETLEPKRMMKDIGRVLDIKRM